jgi:hypothetical protein
MSLRSRLDRVGRWLAPAATIPLTIFLREAGPGLPAGERAVWGGVGREVVYDPAAGLPILPPGGSHKLLLGMDPDWV